MRRRWRSRSAPCRFRITGWLPLTRSPISWASLKFSGSTTCTRAAVVGTLRTTVGRGTVTPERGSSRGMARTVGSPYSGRWAGPGGSRTGRTWVAPTGS